MTQAETLIALAERRCRFGRPRSDRELLNLEVDSCADCGRIGATDPDTDLCCSCAAALRARAASLGEV